jgi:cation transport ATPase
MNASDHSMHVHNHPEGVSAVVYTCPMHPEIRQIGPGHCPKCGMALEPLVTAKRTPRSVDDMTRRLWVSAALTLPLLVVTMSEFVPGLNLHHWFGNALFNWAQGALSTPVVLWAGWPFFARAWISFRTWQLNMFSLIGLGTGGVALQCRCAALAAAAAGSLQDERRGAAVFRGRRRHHHVGAARPGARIARPLPHQRRDQIAAGARAQHGAAHQCRRL